MPYSNSFSRRNPGFLVIMIDQSGSMCATSQNNGLELAENAANSVNNLINELILKLSTVDSTGEEIVKRSINLCYVCSTKIGEISDISKCFENFVSQTLGVLTRIYAAELRLLMK